MRKRNRLLVENGLAGIPASGRKARRAAAMFFCWLCCIWLWTGTGGLLRVLAAEGTVHFGSDSYVWNTGEVSPLGVYFEGSIAVSSYSICLEYDPEVLSYLNGADRTEGNLLWLEGGGGESSYKRMLHFEPLTEAETTVHMVSASGMGMSVAEDGTVTEEAFELAGLAAAPVTVQKKISSNLRSLTVKDAEGMEEFAPERLEYHMQVEYGTKQLSLEYETEDEGADVSVSDTLLEEGENVIVVTVQGLRSEPVEYKLYVERKKDEEAENAGTDRIGGKRAGISGTGETAGGPAGAPGTEETAGRPERTEETAGRSEGTGETAGRSEETEKTAGRSEGTEKTADGIEGTGAAAGELAMAAGTAGTENGEEADAGRKEAEGKQEADMPNGKGEDGGAGGGSQAESALSPPLLAAMIAVSCMAVLYLLFQWNGRRKRKTGRRASVRHAASKADGYEPFRVINLEQTVIELRHVTMNFRMAEEEASSLKEYMIRTLRGKNHYRMFSALKDITFDVKQGEVLGIVGTNGSGKSTLLKIIAGALLPSAGEVIADHRKVQMLTLGTGFDMELTARENVYLNGAIIGYSKEYIDRKYEDIVTFAELEGFMDERMKNFSSGMVSRLGFAIATMRDSPDILILDEVLSVGDMFFRKKSEKRIKEMIHSGATVLIVSHSADVIRKNCDRAVWIEKGVLQMVGKPETVCAAYEKMERQSDATA